MANNTKMVHTALDDLQFGSRVDYEEQIKSKPILPEEITHGELRADVWRITWPSLIELLLTQLTSMADQIMVGRIPGDEGVQSLSAVGVAMQPKFLLMTLVMALNVGVTAVIARYRGQKNQKMVNRTLTQSILLNLIIGFICMSVGLIFGRPLIYFMGGLNLTETTVGFAESYLNINLLGMVPLVMTFTMTAALRGVGETKLPLIYNTVANVVNLVFNYLMIYGKLGFPAMGVSGAAWATDIGQTVAFLIALISVSNQKRYLHFQVEKPFRIDKGLLHNVILVGVPSMIEQLFMRAGIIIYSRAVSSLGDMLFATHQICMNIQAMSFMMGQAFASASTTLVGQSLGKRRLDMARLYMNTTVHMGIVASIILGTFMGIFRISLVGLYNETPLVVSTGAEIMILIALSQPIQAIQFITSGGLRGAGDTKYTAVVMAITVLGVRSILTILLINILKMGLWGAWIAMMSDQCVRTILMVLRYRGGKWSRMRFEESTDS